MEEPGDSDGVVIPVDPAQDISQVVSVDAETIRHKAEERADESTVFELQDREALSAEELREAWVVLDLQERSDGLKLLEQEEAEEFFEQLPAHDQMGMLL